MICPNGFVVQYEDDLVKQYTVDWKIAETTKDLNPLIEKWEYIAPSLIGKTDFCDEVLLPPELSKITLLEKT